MKQTRYRLIFTALAALALLATSCSKEPQDDGSLTDGTYLSLSIDGVKAASSAQLGSRATAVDEGAVNDLWVLQFQMTAGSTTEGTLVAKSYIATVADPAKIKFKAKEGDNMALYLVANSGSSSLFSSTADGTTLATVKATSVSVTTTAGNNFPSDASAHLPMVGQSATLKLPHPTGAVPVVLTRTAAKVVLTITNPLEIGYPQITVSSVQVKNVPNTYLTQVVNVANGFTGTTYYPAASAANFTNYTAVSGNITAAGTTSTYYLAPNVRGISSNTDNRLKSDLTAASGQGNFCTYVEIMGTAKTSATAPAADVHYRLYLGGNNTNDFNLYANTAYKVDVELTGINGNDARMTITTDKFDLVQGGTDGDYSEDIGGFIPPPVIGEFRNGGIVYWIDPTNKAKGKVVSLTQTTAAFAFKSSYVLGVAGQSYIDGKGNVAAMKSYSLGNINNADDNLKTTGVFATDFPAAAYCDNMNIGGVTGWYLPAKTDLQYLWCGFNAKPPTIWESGTPGSGANADGPAADTAAQTVFNDSLTNAGGNKFSTGYFWSSTEYSKTTNFAWYVVFSNGRTDSNAQIDTGPAVRCIRDI